MSAPLHEIDGTCAVDSVHTSRRAPNRQGLGRHELNCKAPPALICDSDPRQTAQRRQVPHDTFPPVVASLSSPGAINRRQHLGRALASHGGAVSFSDVHAGLVAHNGCGATFNFLRSELAGHPAQDCRQPFGSFASREVSVVHPCNLDGVRRDVWSSQG